MAHSRCDVFQHMSIEKPMVLFANAGVLRDHLPSIWKLICSDLLMAPFAAPSIDAKGYYVPRWPDAEVQEAIAQLETP